MVAAPSPTALIVYDLDGVITRKDTFAALLARRLRSSPARFVRALPAILSWVAARDPERRAAAARRLTSIALAGLRGDEYAALAAEIGREFALGAGRIRSETVGRIRREHADGSRIVVATATEHRLAEELLNRAGVPYHLLSASLMTETTRGVEFLDHRVGARKAEALLEAGVPIERAVFVTDSSSDLPTAGLAARTVLVGASERTRRRYLDAGIPLGS